MVGLINITISATAPSTIAKGGLLLRQAHPTVSSLTWGSRSSDRRFAADFLQHPPAVGTRPRGGHPCLKLRLLLPLPFRTFPLKTVPLPGAQKVSPEATLGALPFTVGRRYALTAWNGKQKQQRIRIMMMIMIKIHHHQQPPPNPSGM